MEPTIGFEVRGNVHNTYFSQNIRIDANVYIKDIIITTR